MAPSATPASDDPWHTAAVAALLESSHDGIMAFEAIRGADGEILDFRWTLANTRAGQIVGREPEELMGQRLLEVFPGNGEAGLFDLYRAVVTSREPEHVEQYYEHEGLAHWLQITAVPLGDGFTVTFRDISEHKRLEALLRDRARHDPLTGLLNRDGLHQVLGELAGHTSAGVLFIDLDRLKVVNDAMGHSVGDELLRTVASRLSHEIRADDRVGRFGGDEFVVVAPDLDAEALVNLGERLLRAIRRPVILGSRTITTTASIGAASMPLSEGEPELALRDADSAMYVAKRAGGDRCDVFDAQVRRQVRDRLDVELDLHLALERDEFVVHYQPIIEVATGQVCGAEALVRWAHPIRGLVPPDSFIPVAEDCGLIVPIGRVVLEHTLKQLAEWIRCGRTEIAIVGINAAPAEIVEPGFAENVLSSLARFGIPAAMLGLEITETAMMLDPDATMRAVAALSDAGVTISIDDFGTGYSSMTYLQCFPAHVLKIDRSFVSSMDVSASDRALVAGVVALARSLGKLTVAEGVENGAQAKLLAGMGVDFCQGYHYSRPVQASELLVAGSVTAG